MDPFVRTLECGLQPLPIKVKSRVINQMKEAKVILIIQIPLFALTAEEKKPPPSENM